MQYSLSLSSVFGEQEEKCVQYPAHVIKKKKRSTLMGFPSDAFSTLLHISRPKLDGGRCQTDIHLTWDILDTRPTNKTQTRKYKYNKWKLCYIFPNRRTILAIPTYSICTIRDFLMRKQFVVVGREISRCWVQNLMRQRAF